MTKSGIIGGRDNAIDTNVILCAPGCASLKCTYHQIHYHYYYILYLNTWYQVYEV